MIQENQSHCESKNYCRWLNIGQQATQTKRLESACLFVSWLLMWLFCLFFSYCFDCSFCGFFLFEYYFLVVFVLFCCFCLTKRCTVPCALVRKPISRRNRQTIPAIRDFIFVKDYRAALYVCVEKETLDGFKTQLISKLIFNNGFKLKFGRKELKSQNI